MRELDKAEKQLLDCEDVFADIVNVLLFRGELRVRAEELRPSTSRTVYKEAGELREQERDVAKYWEVRGVRQALLGLQNQTGADGRMPIRIVGYDGAAYRNQIRRHDDLTRLRRRGAASVFYPSISVVLYYGEKPWSGPLGLREELEIPPGLEEFVSDYQIAVFEIAFLPDETIAGFRSDFRTVAELFKQSRLLRERKISRLNLTQRRIEHKVETLGLLRAIVGDERFENLFNEMEDGGEGQMFAAFDILYENGKEEGLKEGRREGRRKGRAAERSAGLRAIVRSLKKYLDDADAVCRAVKQNSEYAGVSEETIKRIYAEV